MIGLTSTGAVKIKTDGGLRAVGCACCNPCDECFTILIPQALREIVANATINTVTLQGYSPINFFPYYYNDTWLARFSNVDPTQTDFYAEVSYNKTTGCLSSTFITYGNTGIGGGYSDAAFGDGQICEETTTENGTFFINDVGGFPYFYLTGGEPPYEIAPPPNFVFT